MRRLIAHLAALTGFAAVLASSAQVPTASAADAVKVALPVSSLESMPIYVAQDKGYFKAHGVEVDVIDSRGGGEAMRAYIAGEVQIVATGFPEVGLMRARNVDVELFFAQMSRVPFALVAEKSSGIKSVAGLKGKTIAVTSPGSLTANLALYFVKQAGLDPQRDVSLVSVGGGGEILGALKSKRADAAMLFEPFVTIGVQGGFAEILVDVAAELDAYSSSPLAVSKAYLEKSPEQAKAVFAALSDALAFIHADTAGVYEIAQKRFANAKPEVLKAALDRLGKYYSPNGKFTKGNIERTQAISVELKIMPRSYPYDDVVAPMARE